MIALLLLGFALGLDSFRVSIGLGALRLMRRQQIVLAASFGIGDGVAPLVGLWVGRSALGSWHGLPSLAGPLLLAAYGLSLATSRVRSDDGAERRWHLLGLPLVLSLDNLVGGVGLGLLGYSPWSSAAVLGVTSALLALAGLRVGALISTRLSFQPERVSGVLLIAAAVVAMARPD